MLKLCTVLGICLGLLLPNLSAQSPMSPPDFNASQAAGIVIYDQADVIKRVKIQDPETQNIILDALKVFNSKMDAINYEHAATFSSLEKEFDENVQIAMRNRDRSQMNGIRSKIQETIVPIRKQVQDEEKRLNETMALVLNEKQIEKWLKYQSRKKPQTFPGR